MGAPHVLVAGGGLVGFSVALGLEHMLEPHEARVTLVNPENFMLYQSLLPEVASGMIEPRHVVVPLRRALRRTRVITGRLTALDHEHRTATLVSVEGEERRLEYDHVVVALGGMARVPPVPGLAEVGIGFQTVAEALYLRNHVLARMEVAEATSDPDVRRRALTFVFVGGGYSGVEAVGELQDLAADAATLYPSVSADGMRWVLVEMTGRLLPSVDRSLADHALGRLRERGIEVHLETKLDSAVGGHIQLSDGTELDSDTLVWVAGVRPARVLSRLGLPLDDRGRLPVDSCLRVRGVEGAWSAGDCAAVPDIIRGGLCPPSGQYALREARRLAKNLVATLRDQPLTPFRYRKLGEVISLGRHQGVAQILGVRLRGFPAWTARRFYHIARIPSLNRKLRVWLDWTVALGFPRDITSLGSSQHPRAAIETAARDD
ncbi:MAG: NAD(P)/FAD-dependent oxidoreductase [Egibacteraceae bacterium]